MTNPSRLPAGRYFSLLKHIRPSSGGGERVSLLRQRMFYEFGVPNPLLVFDPNPDYASVQERLKSDGYMHPDAQILNLWHWFVDNRLPNLPATNECEPIPTAMFTTKTVMKGNHNWSTVFLLGEQPIAREFHRPDGTKAIRHIFGEADKFGISPRIELIDQQEQIVKQFKSEPELHKYWFSLLAPEDENVFLLVDDWRLVETFINLDERFFTFFQLHNRHSFGPSYLSDIREAHKDVLKAKNQIDGFSILTEQQKSDLEKRFGVADNFYVIPNAISPPKTLGDQNHFANLIATNARLAPQKRLDRAIRAFSILLKQIPDAKFHIHGSGQLKNQLVELINELDVGHAVVLKGYDPKARENLNDVVCYWNTSRYEGFSLATLEAMSQGCPVVAFDVKYGLRDHVINDFNGFLIEEDDIASFVERTVSIMKDRELFNRLSKGAFETAQKYPPAIFFENTVGVLQSMVDKRPLKTYVRSVKVINKSIRFAKSLQRMRFDLNLSLSFNIELEIDAYSARGPLTKESFFLEVISLQSENLVRLPMEVATKGNQFLLNAQVSTSEMKKAIQKLGPGARHIELRVGFAWGNSTWVHPLSKRIRLLAGKDQKPYALIAIHRITFRRLRNKVRSMLKT